MCDGVSAAPVLGDRRVDKISVLPQAATVQNMRLRRQIYLQRQANILRR